MSHIGGVNTNSTSNDDNGLNESGLNVVDDVASRFESMNVDITDETHSLRLNLIGVQQTNSPTNRFTYNSINQQPELQTTNNMQSVYCTQDQQLMDASRSEGDKLIIHQATCDQGQAMTNIAYNSLDKVNSAVPDDHLYKKEHSNISNTLTVTGLDPSIFSNESLRSTFESLFRQYDQNITFRYLKSFKRVRLDFSTAHQAELARSNLHNYRLGNSQIKCYHLQIIKPSSIGLGARDRACSDNPNDESEMEMDSTYLRIPKPTKQFLISPPASPPVDWEPVTESSPCIDVQLISAIANLVPGEAHEIHAGNESQPCIVVEVCEEPHFEKTTRTACSKSIPRTMSPLMARQQS